MFSSGEGTPLVENMNWSQQNQTDVLSPLHLMLYPS
jgi:hypothetical protein